LSTFFICTPLEPSETALPVASQQTIFAGMAARRLCHGGGQR
jgi:hypothetical protein